MQRKTAPLGGAVRRVDGWCPRWDSNPHCRWFEHRASAGCATGAGKRAYGRSPRVRDVEPATRVLIAEDEALIRLDLREMLVEEGYDVCGETGDGESAVRLAQELRPGLVILDVKMPVLDGISAAEQIVAERIAPVVMLTAFSQRDLVARAREAGAMAYLVKPFQ